MIDTKYPIYLASKSPRRKILLKQIGLDFKTFSVELNEEILDGEHPIKTVKRLSLEKLKIAEERISNGIVITADTIVVIDKEIIGKPRTKSEAKKILKKLSGKTHFVYTGYSIKNSSNNKLITEYSRTSVTFRKLSISEIDNYIKSGSPMDKAGAYGIQDDYGAVFISKIRGCYYNVVGLPLSKVYMSLLEII
ncbi:MAG: Maf family protein [Bacteroidota bacterium]